MSDSVPKSLSKLFRVKKQSSLDVEAQKLMQLTMTASENAYAPYSGFKVGAALLLDEPDFPAKSQSTSTEYESDMTQKLSTSIVTGCNVENASFGLTICAERTAITKAVSTGLLSSSSSDIRAVYVYADMAEKEAFVWPCGACRQVLSEFNPCMEVWSVRKDGFVAQTSLDRLLPLAFSPKSVALDFYNDN